MSYKLLDSNGLSRLWSKMKETFVNKNQINAYNGVCKLDGNYVPPQRIKECYRIYSATYPNDTSGGYMYVYAPYSIITLTGDTPASSSIYINVDNLGYIGVVVIDINTCILDALGVTASVVGADSTLTFDGKSKATRLLTKGHVYRIVFDFGDSTAYMGAIL